MVIQVDESKLSFDERLGLAWCRLNQYEWDELVGPKPPEFDEIPEVSVKRQPDKGAYIRPAMLAIEAIIGKANCSRYWWRFVLEKTEEDWFRWYVLQAREGF